jgi:hypothetical protein
MTAVLQSREGRVEEHPRLECISKIAKVTQHGVEIQTCQGWNVMKSIWRLHGDEQLSQCYPLVQRDCKRLIWVFACIAAVIP